MIVVDTSVWVAFFRGSPRSTGERLKALLDDDQVAMPVPVRVEILGGARSENLVQLRRLLSALPTLYPTEQAWVRMEAWAARSARAGQRFGVGDLLIASLAAEQRLPLWSLDRDFDRMARLGFIEIHTWQDR